MVEDILLLVSLSTFEAFDFSGLGLEPNVAHPNQEFGVELKVACAQEFTQSLQH